MSGHLLQGLCVAVDVHYLHSGRARAAAADAVFWQLLAEHIAMVSQVPPYPADRPGLGAQAHHEFAVPVIGVAKSVFRTATHAIPVLRGRPARPLFVTAAGMPRADAAELVRLTAGRFRVPDALRRADMLARTGPPTPIQRSGHPG